MPLKSKLIAAFQWRPAFCHERGYWQDNEDQTVICCKSSSQIVHTQKHTINVGLVSGSSCFLHNLCDLRSLSRRLSAVNHYEANLQVCSSHSAQVFSIRHWWNKRPHQERWVCQSDKQFAKRWKDLVCNGASLRCVCDATGKLDFVVIFGVWFVDVRAARWNTKHRARKQQSRVASGNMSSHQVKRFDSSRGNGS